MIFFFDLDGTLHDPKEGITRSYQYALEKLGQTPPHEDELEWVIGPPLIDSFSKFFPDDLAQAKKGVEYYRERYSQEGILETYPYDGIEELLKDLKGSGNRLFVVTSKPGVYADKIIKRSGWGELFEKVYGCQLDGTHNDKAELMAHLLEVEGVSAADCVMIGDRQHDIIAAQKNGVRSVGVLYGYGSQEELETHGAGTLVTSVKELRKLFE